MKFLKYQFLINKNYPTISDFAEMKDIDYMAKTNIYKITIQKFENRFLWIYAKFGGALPYSNEVFDAEQEQIVDNPRSKTQTELNKQIFSLYDFQSQTLFLQKDNDKAFLTQYFKENIQKDCIIKRFFKSPQDFIDSIDRIKKISFTSKRNIITSQVELFNNIENIFGLGQPEKFYISMDYKGRNKTNSLIDFFRDFVARKNDLEIDSLVVVGENDNDVDSVFDIDSYIESAEISISKDDNGMYDENAVMDNLISKIKENENV